MTHWTQVLSNVSVVEFVLLAVLTALQWVRHRIRGAGWVALTFAIIGGVSLALEIRPTLATDQPVATSLVALLLVTPYCLFRFATTFHRPRRIVRDAAVVVTVAMVAYTVWLGNVGVPGQAVPPDVVAYRVSFGVALGFLFASVVVRLAVGGRGEPLIAATRMRLLAVAVVGLGVPVVVVALGLHGPTVDLVTRIVTVVTGVLFLVALVLPSFVTMFVSRKEDAAFRRAVAELVSASDSREVGERLLPHVCALVGASKAALLRSDGTVVAHVPAWPAGDEPEDWGEDGEGDERRARTQPRITVRTHSGSSHQLAVTISPAMPYFGTEELHTLDQLADMVGLAVERCEMAEQMAYDASHDGLTGLANRNLFMERLEEALTHVGRRRRALAVLFIDLDRFKLVNDRADHAAGDVVLCEMARRLTAMTRGVDVVARFGGDEFVALAEVDHAEDALDMAERIRAGLAEPVTVGEERLVVTASVGLAVVSDRTSNPAAVLRDADDAMYEAKRRGRDRVVLHRAHARDTANRKWGLRPTRAARLNAG